MLIPDHIPATVTRRYRALAHRFTYDNPAACPPRLRPGHSREAWADIPGAQRYDVVLAKLLADYEADPVGELQRARGAESHRAAQRRTRTPRQTTAPTPVVVDAPAPPAEDTPAPPADATPTPALRKAPRRGELPTLWVACACCGTPVPTHSRKPMVVYCKRTEAGELQARPAPSRPSVGHGSASSSASEPSDSTTRPTSRRTTPRKKRNRSTCGWKKSANLGA